MQSKKEMEISIKAWILKNKNTYMNKKGSQIEIQRIKK